LRVFAVTLLVVIIEYPQSDGDLKDDVKKAKLFFNMLLDANAVIDDSRSEMQQ
jgi:hypothetical protein